MKKTLALILAVTMIFMGVAGCGKKETEKPAQTPADSTNTATDDDTPASVEPVTLKVANYAVLETGYTEFWESVKAGFEEKYPNITVEWITAPYGEITNQVVNMAGGGDKVDLIFGENSWIPTYEDAGLAAPIDTILDEEFLADFYPNTLDAVKVDGEMYGIPLYMSNYVLYYNKDIFEKAGLDPNLPPTTYEEMLEMAEKIAPLTTDDGNKIYPFGQTTASVPISGTALTAMLYNFGGHLLNDDGSINEDTKELKETMEMLALLDDKEYNPQNAKLKDLRNLFALGQLAMYYDQSWGFNGVSSINPNAKDFTASAAPLKGGSGDGSSLIQEQVFILVDTDEARNEATKLFVEYVITKDVLEEYITKITPAYPVKNDMSDIQGVLNSEVLKGAADSMKNAKAAPTMPAMEDLNLELCTLAQAVTISGTDIDEAIDNFVKIAKGLA